MDLQGKKIDLGCGIDNLEGYIHLDRYYHSPHIDIAWDLNYMPYPFKDNTFSEVRMYDVFEHLDKPLEVLNEIHRILIPSGIFDFRVPTIEDTNLWGDITHKRPFTERSFDHFIRGTIFNTNYGYYSDRLWELADRQEAESGRAIIFKLRKV
ncbi:MAG TPA: methyltransferase domain-containing protein [Candidatus Dojkabacteria bacterium]|nr:methyltransferase domain-containing protein [Candidatus Dojkabacteria bacterium]